jgi:hypothetical protein
MFIDYFNSYTYACSLDIAAQIKIIEELSFVFTGLNCVMEEIRVV